MGGEHEPAELREIAALESAPAAARVRSFSVTTWRQRLRKSSGKLSAVSLEFGARYVA